MTLDPALFGDGPAREPRFRVVDHWAECANFPETDPRKQQDYFHRQMNEECNVMENAARNLAEFPEADWSLRMGLARQISDEARHVLAYRRLLERRGVALGQYPVLNFQYRLLSRVTTLIGRLAVQNRSFEAEGLDAATFALAEARRVGDQDLVNLYEAQQADEVQHIRFANEWIRQRIREAPRDVMPMARALDQAARGFAQVFDGGGADVTAYGVAVEARLAAGFGQDEVDTAVQLSDARRAAVTARKD